MILRAVRWPSLCSGLNAHSPQSFEVLLRYNTLRHIISANTFVDETLITCPCLEDKLSTLEKTEYESVTKEIFEHVIPSQHSRNLHSYNNIDNKGYAAARACAYQDEGCHITVPRDHRLQ